MRVSAAVCCLAAEGAFVDRALGFAGAGSGVGVASAALLAFLLLHPI